MPSQNSFRKMALSLPDSEESPHFDKASFRIGKKIFATLWEKENRAMLKLSPVEQSVYCQFDPGSFSPVPGTWGAGGATFVALGKVKTEVLKEALSAAHSLLVKGKK
jgi:predicted DNA-binding protein (MmcQ/YjbR family)